MTVTSSPAGEHAGTRHTADSITSDALDELYNEIGRLRADIAGCRAQQWPQRLGAAEKQLAHVRHLRDTWLLMTLEPGQVRRLLDGITTALDEPKED